uniref:NSF attachment protein alpha n=1 Tax=Sus scrofa TaxID=9823 RepID=A0A8D1BL34_PIG
MDNSGKEAEAMALLAEAERKVKNSQSFFSGLFGGSSKIEEACEIYARAANMFKMAKNWSAAGNAFCQAAQLHLQLQSKHDAATCFVDAGNAFKKADPQEAINCLMRAIEIYTDMGRFTIAAKHHISIAEIYETELVDIEKAIAHYEQSADYYKGEESNSSANKCLLKVAGYAAQLEQYQKAIDIYEQVGLRPAPPAAPPIPPFHAVPSITPSSHLLRSHRNSPPVTTPHRPRTGPSSQASPRRPQGEADPGEPESGRGGKELPGLGRPKAAGGPGRGPAGERVSWVPGSPLLLCGGAWAGFSLAGGRQAAGLGGEWDRCPLSCSRSLPPLCPLVCQPPVGPDGGTTSPPPSQEAHRHLASARGPPWSSVPQSGC